MGRIAEALKRAQQERARRRESESDGPGAGPADASPVCGGAHRDKGPARGDRDDVLSRASMLSAPPAKPFIVSSSPILPECIDPRVVVLHDARSVFAERYRSARTRLLTANPDGSTRVFAITSSLPKEGKTVTTANLAFSLAELRHLRVAMLDFDFRRRGLSRLCQVADKPGVAEVLRGEKTLAEVCLPAVRANLHLVPTGDPREASPSELLVGERVAALMKEISERFHYALIDTPPTSTVADIGLIGPLCHAAVIVVRMGRTPEPLLRQCAQLLQANHVLIAGAILAGECDELMVGSDNRDYGNNPP